MTMQELQEVMLRIRLETYKYCAGTRPAPHEIDSLSMMVSLMTLSRLSNKAYHQVNQSGWYTAVNNTVKRILENS